MSDGEKGLLAVWSVAPLVILANLLLDWVVTRLPRRKD